MKIGILVFDQMTQLDATGPYEVLANVPGAKVLLVAKRRGTVTAQHGLRIGADLAWKDCPKLDLICVPGGPGIGPLMADREAIDFVRRQAKSARFVTSVCTGSLLLGACGLLKGKRAASHWASLRFLPAFGAKPSSRRIERDGKYITAGGVTSGIDFGLWLAAKLSGEAAAKQIQLRLQYDPQPPFRSGTPRQAGARVTGIVLRGMAKGQSERAALISRLTAKTNPSKRKNPRPK